MDILDVILDGSSSVERVSSDDTSALVQLNGVAASATVEAIEQVSYNDEAMDEDRRQDHRAEKEVDRNDNGGDWRDEEMVDDGEHRGSEDNSPFQEEPCDENPAGDGSSIQADSVDDSELNRSSSRGQNDGVDDSMDTSATEAQQKQQQSIRGTRQQQQEQQHGRQGHGSKSTLGRDRAYSGTEQSSVHSTTRSTDGATARLTRSRSRSLTKPAAINAASSGRGSGGGGGGIRAGSAGSMSMNMTMNINANVVAQQKRKLPAEPAVRRPLRRSRIPFDVTSMTYEQYCEKYYSVEIEKYKQGVIAKTFGPNVTYNPHAASARRNIHASMNNIHSGGGTSGTHVVQNKANINLNYNNNINNNSNSSSMSNGNYGKYGPGGGGVMNMKGGYGNPTAATAISTGAGGGASGRPRSRSPATTIAGSAGKMGLYVKSLPNPVHSTSPSTFVPDGKFVRSPARNAEAGAATNRGSHVYDKNNDNNNNNVINDGNDHDNKHSNLSREAGDQQAAFLAASWAVSGFSSCTASGDEGGGMGAGGSVEAAETGGGEGEEKAEDAAGKERVDWNSSSSTAEQAFASIEDALADTAAAAPGGDGVGGVGGGDGDGSLIYDDAPAATDTWKENSNVDLNEGEQQKERCDPKDSAMDTDSAGAEIKAADDQDFAAEG